MKLVVIESPYAGDVEANVAYAKECMKDSLRKGEAPIASHLLYPQILDDMIPEERYLGMEAGFYWGAHATVIAVYTDLGISPGMGKAIECYRQLKVPIEYRTLDRQVDTVV